MCELIVPGGWSLTDIFHIGGSGDLQETTQPLFKTTDTLVVPLQELARALWQLRQFISLQVGGVRVA
jgi:hypothetical protein